MRKVRIAGLQAPIHEDSEQNLKLFAERVHSAADKGAELILLPELFECFYFCTHQREENFSWAHEIESHPAIKFFLPVTEKRKICLPLSIFEKAGPHFYNSVAILNSGRVEGVYRKSHIPDGPGYQEKYYFRPGNTGFKVWKFKDFYFGVGICWDQWFPETARALVLAGAELLLYPTAIGSEPLAPEMDTSQPWQRAMIGHAVSNCVPVMAVNRVGQEPDQSYYGSSFIADAMGEKLQEAGREEEKILIQDIDLDEAQRTRASFGFFRDRRPELYSALTQA